MNVKRNIKPTYKITAALVAALIVLPVVVKFAHAFTHQNHYICFEKQTTHFHSKDLDCDFYKFKLNTKHLAFNKVKTPKNKSTNYKIYSTNYYFKPTFSKLQFSLRAPPHLV
ncbi:MAG: hypothetical protein ACPGUH_01045 [Winogradskyella sp.]